MKKKILLLIVFGAGSLALAHDRCRDLRGASIPCGFHTHYPDIYPSYTLYEYRINFSGKNKTLRRKVEKTISLAWHGNVKSQVLLAHYYKKGFGVRQSFPKAYAWLKTAAKKDLTAQYKLHQLVKKLTSTTIEEGEQIASRLIVEVEQYQLERQQMFDELHEKQGLQ